MGIVHPVPTRDSHGSSAGWRCAPGVWADPTNSPTYGEPGPSTTCVIRASDFDDLATFDRNDMTIVAFEQGMEASATSHAAPSGCCQSVVIRGVLTIYPAVLGIMGNRGCRSGT